MLATQFSQHFTAVKNTLQEDVERFAYDTRRINRLLHYADFRYQILEGEGNACRYLYRERIGTGNDEFNIFLRDRLGNIKSVSCGKYGEISPEELGGLIDYTIEKDSFANIIESNDRHIERNKRMIHIFYRMSDLILSELNELDREGFKQALLGDVDAKVSPDADYLFNCFLSIKSDIEDVPICRELRKYAYLLYFLDSGISISDDFLTITFEQCRDIFNNETRINRRSKVLPHF
jgi:hypothetical protein